MILLRFSRKITNYFLPVFLMLSILLSAIPAQAFLISDVTIVANQAQEAVVLTPVRDAVSSVTIPQEVIEAEESVLDTAEPILETVIDASSDLPEPVNEIVGTAVNIAIDLVNQIVGAIPTTPITPVIKPILDLLPGDDEGGGTGCTVNCGGNGCVTNCDGCVINCGNGDDDGGCTINCDNSGGGNGCTANCNSNDGPVECAKPCVSASAVPNVEKIVLNNGALSTGSRMVIVDVFVSSSMIKMSLSNTPDFKDAVIVDLKTPYDWDICGSNVSDLIPCEIGKHTVYAKFYDANDAVSPVASDDIGFESVAELCPFFSEYVKVGSKDAEVIKIKQFLKDIGLYSGDAASNTFDTDLFDSIGRFQTRYSDDILAPWELTRSTGYWYKTTRAKANDVKGCSEIVQLTDDEVNLYDNQRAEVLAKIELQKSLAKSSGTDASVAKDTDVAKTELFKNNQFTANVGSVGNNFFGPVGNFLGKILGF